MVQGQVFFVYTGALLIEAKLFFFIYWPCTWVLNAHAVSAPDKN